MKEWLEITIIVVIGLIINLGAFSLGRWSKDIEINDKYNEAGCNIEDGDLVCPLELDKLPQGKPQICIGNDCMEITDSTPISQEIYCQKSEYDGKEYASCSLVDVPFQMLDKFDEFNLTPEEAFEGALK